MTAQILLDTLRKARRYADPDDAWRYDKPLEQADRLVRYFRGMADYILHMCTELEGLSRYSGALLEDNEMRTKSINRSINVDDFGLY